jgi:acetyltransferase-like isoleucine patch superfamily enzyme
VEQEILKRFKHLGQNVDFRDNVRIYQPEKISIGDNVKFYYGVYVEPAGAEIVIGSNSHFAPYTVMYGPLEIGEGCCVAAHVVLASVGHSQDPVDVPFHKLPAVKKMIVIEDNVWIGANAVILQGIRIGTGSIIGAGAVVTHDVEPYSVMGGVPARLIRKRK